MAIISLKIIFTEALLKRKKCLEVKKTESMKNTFSGVPEFAILQSRINPIRAESRILAVFGIV